MMNSNQFRLEIRSMPSGGFIVSDANIITMIGPGAEAHQVYACSTLDEALQFVRSVMTIDVGAGPEGPRKP